jgi:hypothetical protein
MSNLHFLGEVMKRTRFSAGCLLATAKQRVKPSAAK